MISFSTQFKFQRNFCSDLRLHTKGLAEWGGQDITIRFAASGGLEQLVRLLMPYIDKEKARRGARLVVGGN